MANNLFLENVQIGFRNFSGKGDRYNKEGDRNFCIFFDDPDQALSLKNEGWNIKEYQSKRDPEAEPRYYLQVSVSYKVRPPKVVMVDGSNQFDLGEEDISQLDWQDIDYCDVVINPYNWEVQDRNGVNRGVKAYLKKLYAVLVDDPITRKYEHRVQEEMPF